MRDDVTEWVQQVVELRRAAAEPTPEGDWVIPDTQEAGGDIE